MCNGLQPGGRPPCVLARSRTTSWAECGSSLIRLMSPRTTRAPWLQSTVDWMAWCKGIQPSSSTAWAPARGSSKPHIFKQYEAHCRWLQTRNWSVTEGSGPQVPSAVRANPGRTPLRRTPCTCTSRVGCERTGRPAQVSDAKHVTTWLEAVSLRPAYRHIGHAQITPCATGSNLEGGNLVTWLEAGQRPGLKAGLRTSS